MARNPGSSLAERFLLSRTAVKLKPVMRVSCMSDERSGIWHTQHTKLPDHFRRVNPVDGSRVASQ
jgi:hypothetical protein